MMIFQGFRYKEGPDVAAGTFAMPTILGKIRGVDASSVPDSHNARQRILLWGE
jgi:hypothetical protein